MTKIRKRRKKKRVKIVERKLGKERAYGLFWDDNLMELDQRLKGKNHLTVALHESLHCCFKQFLSEFKVEKYSKIIADILWRLNYRRVDNSEKRLNF